MNARVGVTAACLKRPAALDFTEVAVALLMTICVVVVGTISLHRQYFNVDTETDFLGAFMLDAERLARGEPLLLLNHPPGYPALLALAHGALGDWLASGLLVSWLSVIGALVGSYALLRRLGGNWVALGGLVALAVSDVFLAFGAQAASDVPFLALWVITLAVTAAALDAGRRSLWFAGGALAGLALLTRSTGLPLVLVLLAPFLADHGWRGRLVDSALATAAFFMPIGAWVAFAVVTGSPVTPTENYPTLALAYADGRVTGDTLFQMRDRFASAWEVIIHDPSRLITIYLKNLARLPGHIVGKTTWSPVALVGALAIPLWLLKVRDPRVLLVGLTAIAGVLFTNLNPVFEARYYLFLVPVLGASAGLAVSLWLDRAPRLRLASMAIVALITAIAGAGLFQAASRAHPKAEPSAVRAELVEAVPAVSRHTSPSSIIVSYKVNVAIHAGRRTAMLPSVTTIEKLCAPVQNLMNTGSPAYIYIGYAERRRSRVELARQLLGSDLPVWLTVTAEGGGGGGWRLLAVKRARCGS